MRSSLRLAFCLIGGALACGPTLHAQSFVGVGPVRNFTLPTEPRGEPAPLPASVVVPQSVLPRSPAPVQDGLRRLPVTLKGFRFDGEWAQGDWPVYLTAAQARRKARFRLAFLSAISVMPEGSRLTLSVNDTVISRTRLAPPEATASEEFEIPAGLLKPGFNAVRIVAEQRHRVDCSPQATYELWTALDPARTGLVLGGDAMRLGFESAADIAAVAPRRDGASPIRIILTGKLTPEMAGRAVKAAQIAALSGHWLQPVVDFSAAGQSEAVREQGGLDLAIGTIDDLSARLDMTDFGAVAGPRHGFLPTRPDRAPTFVVTGATAADLDLALERWNAEREAAGVGAGTEAGLRALATLPGFTASGASERIALNQTGFASTEFSGRLFRLGLDIAMPMDFMPADYDRMALNLAGSHDAGLTAEARILVEVNGRTAGTQLLSRGDAGALDRNQIFLPLSLMRPGQNRIEITAQVPMRGDEACLAQGTARRLQILDRSELVLPRIARIGRSPELALLAAGGFPFARDGARPILYVPTPDRQTMAAAATLAARLGVAAGRPIDFAFAMTPPALDAGEVLMVSPAPALEPALMRAAGLDPERVRQAWQHSPDGARQIAPATDGDLQTTRCLLPQLPPAAPVKIAARDEAGFSFASLGLRASLPAPSFWQGVEPQGARSEGEVVSARASLLVAQDFPVEQAKNLWTVFTASDAGALKAGIECLTHPQIWSGLGGRISALGQDESVSFVSAGDHQRLVATQSFGIANSRLVAAGWLSLNPLAYVGLALLLVLCLAASTLWLVLNTGRRQE